jgi:spore coat protein U domain-containing protein, fimbrial subunit CupE1/2/3/6
MPGAGAVRRLFAAATILLASHGANAQCVIAAVPVNFGVYQPFSAIPVDSNGNITVRCQFFGSYKIALSSGLTGNVTDRRMSRAGSQLSYQLYINPARHTVWGDGTGGSVTVVGLCPGNCDNNYPVYGRMPPRQSVAPGTYVDTITVTVIF